MARSGAPDIRHRSHRRNRRGHRAGLRPAVCGLGLPVLLAAACVGPLRPGPTDEELAAADHGPPPTNYVERVLDYSDTMMIEFMRTEIGTPRKTWYGTTGVLGRPRDVRFGWAVGFRGFAMTSTPAERLAAEAVYYFRDDHLDAIRDAQGLRFVSPDVDAGR